MKKKHMIAVLALALCTVLCIVGASALSGGKAVSISEGRFHVRFSLPDGWEYRTETSQDADNPLTIYLWPSGHDEKQIRLECMDLLGLHKGTYMPRVGTLGPDFIDLDIGHYGYLSGGSLGASWWEEFGCDVEEFISSLEITAD